jgi:hypothetical protein
MRRARQKRDTARERAFLQAGVNLGLPIRFYEWTGATEEAYDAQWLPLVDRREPHFHWPHIHDLYKGDMDRFVMAMWADDRLAGLALIHSAGASVSIEALEGDARPDCPLKGKRTVGALEVATCYAQAMDRKTLRIEAVNDTLMRLYTETYGFSLEKRVKQAPYPCFKEI